MDDELGLAMVLLHRARESLSTLECTHWTWTHHLRLGLALERSRARHGGTHLVGRGAGVVSTTSERESQLWFSPPDRGRVDHEGAVDVHRDGEHWHVPAQPGAPVVHQPKRDRAQHEHGLRRVLAGTSGPLETVQLLVDPRPLLVTCDLRATGTAEVDGRPTLELVATPRMDLDPPLSLLTVEGQLRGAEELTLQVDRSLGILLRTEARVEGWPFFVQELRSVRTGHHISASRFEPPSPGGREVLTPDELVARLEAERAERDGQTWRHGHRHTPTGPPPDDEPAATLAIQGALNALFAHRDQDVDGVEGGEGLGPILDHARDRTASVAGEVSLRLEEARYLHPRLAEITCTIVAKGPGNGLQLQGFAFEQEGRWLISRETLAGLLAMGGVQLPPRTVGLDPG